MVVTDHASVVGYYCLATGGVHHDSHPLPKLRRNMPNPIPVLILGRLAVDRNFQGNGIGSSLLQDAMRRTLSLHADVGFAALVVHAIDDEARAFYIKYGMQEFPIGTRSLYMPIDTIAAAIL
jgi:GNAT superfamily N-acetyltransferase